MMVYLKTISHFLLGYFLIFPSFGMEIDEISPKRGRETSLDDSDRSTKCIKLTHLTAKDYFEEARQLEADSWLEKDEDCSVKLLGKTLPLYAKAAKEGHGEAKGRLEEIFKTHSKIEADNTINQEMRCQNRQILGIMLENGWGVDQDFFLAAQYYGYVGKGGIKIGHLGLPIPYSAQSFTEEITAKWLKIVGYSTRSFFTTSLGFPRYSTPSHLTKCEVGGNGRHLYTLGILYANGWGCQQNYNKAAQLLLQSYKETSKNISCESIQVINDTNLLPFIIDTLGTLWEEDVLDNEGILGAAHEFHLGASLGHEGAKIKLADLHKKYQGDTNNGVAEAQYIVGKLYQYGWGVPLDLDEAGKLFRLSAAQNYKEALCLTRIDYNDDFTIDFPEELWEVILSIATHYESQLDISSLNQKQKVHNFYLKLRRVNKNFFCLASKKITKITLIEPKLTELGGMQSFQACVTKEVFPNLVKLNLGKLDFSPLSELNRELKEDEKWYISCPSEWKQPGKPTIEEESDIDQLFSFVNALNLKKLIYRGINYEKRFYEKLAENTTLTSLKIIPYPADEAHNETYPDTWTRLCESLRKNTTLTALKFYWVYEHDWSVLNILPSVFEARRDITSLSFHWYDSDLGMVERSDQFFNILRLHESLRSLRLKNIDSYLTDEWSITLGDYLKTTSSLTHLDLSSYDLNDSQVKSIADVLANNKALCFLNLRCPKCGKEGVESFTKALRDNTTLTDLCLDVGQDCTDDDYKEIRGFSEEITGSLSRNKTLKAYSSLSLPD